MDKPKPRQAQSIRAESVFRALLAELGATLLEPEWLGARVNHHIRCAAGHDCWPKPNMIQQGQGPCKTCAGHDPADAERRFRVRLAELGAVLIGPYKNTKTPVQVRCAAGHDTHPTPSSVLSGRGVCITCAGKSPVVAEAAFRARVIELGGEPLYAEWRGMTAPHHVRCPVGHDGYPRPNDVQQGDGICWACSGHNPAVAEAAFLARLEALGATPLYEKWLGVNASHHVRCKAGHDCYPSPGRLKRGSGICRYCHGGGWDVFYVVTSGPVVKFGITSGDPGSRLRDHALNGFTEVLRTAAGLPGTVALDTERAVKAALAMAGETPVRGREYFDASCLALILDIADSWLQEELSAD